MQPISIPVFKPHIGSETTRAAVEALDLGWLGMGSYVKDFEERLAAYLELPAERRLVAVNTGTSALHLALEVAGVGPGDEVITPALNNIGDFQAIGMCGARPVFVDIREQDLGIDASAIEALIGPKVKAIIALHYMGVPCDIGAVREVAQRRGLRVIEDAAHAVGTRVHGRPIGSDGDLSCFSFDAIKTLTCIDGGAISVPSAADAEKLYPARLLGMTQSNNALYANSRAYRYDVRGQGYRYHLANLHAAIGLSQLAKLPEFIGNRRAYCRLYNQLLADVPGIVTPRSDFDDASMFHYVIRVLDGRREELADALRARGIDTGIHWIPGNRYSWLADCRGAQRVPVTDRVGREILTLPLWSYMTETVIETVAEAVRDFFGRPRRVRGPERVAAARRGSYGVNITDAPGVRLRAVTAVAPDDGDVQRLTDWRNRHVRSFLTEFDATPERTRSWLTGHVAHDGGRVLFMIEEPGKAPLGYVGLAFIDWQRRYGEADAVVRGEDGRPGIMTLALRALLAWARSELGLSSFGVRVLADNPALAFYEKFGFRELRRVPLRRVVRSDCVAWEEAVAETAVPLDARYLVHLELDT